MHYVYSQGIQFEQLVADLLRALGIPMFAPMFASKEQMGQEKKWTLCTSMRACFVLWR